MLRKSEVDYIVVTHVKLDSLPPSFFRLCFISAFRQEARQSPELRLT